MGYFRLKLPILISKNLSQRSVCWWWEVIAEVSARELIKRNHPSLFLSRMMAILLQKIGREKNATLVCEMRSVRKNFLFYFNYHEICAIRKSLQSKQLPQKILTGKWTFSFFILSRTSANLNTLASFKEKRFIFLTKKHHFIVIF